MKNITFFEPLFQELRIRKVLPHLKNRKILIDIGCDQPQVFIDRVKKDMKSCIGVDIVVDQYSYENVRILSQDLQKKIVLPSNSGDIITMMAVLEHMRYPEEIVRECYRILKKDGFLLITVPSPLSKPLLELFARLGLVRKEMIEQHENYFTRERLRTLMKNTGFRHIDVHTFEFGLNTFCKAIK